jgi:hypothetical protein
MEHLIMSIERSFNCGLFRHFALFAVQAFLLLGLCQPAVAQGDGKSGPRFPRIATISIGNGIDLANPERLEIISRTDVAILGLWPGWGPFNGMTMADVVNRVRSKNSNILVAPYTNTTEANESKTDIFKKVSSETGPNGKQDWWLRKSDGTQTSHWLGNFSVNHSHFVTPDANGERYPEWLAKYNFNNLFSKAPFNAVFSDVMTAGAHEVADWDGDGVNDEKNGAVAIKAVTEGHVTYMNKMAELKPGLVRIGNLTETFHPSRTLPDSYVGLIEGGRIEGALGQTWSIETWHGWSGMMYEYRRLMASIREPKIAIINAHVKETDYKLLRYGLTSTLMDNGYFAADPNGLPDFSWQFWYDEFDLDLGYAIDGPQTSAWSNGVYRREFQNGLVLVNPRGNGIRTVDVGSGWKRFSGTQDPSHNSGQRVETLSLEDADGIILLRVDGAKEAEKKPLPPELH